MKCWRASPWRSRSTIRTPPAPTGNGWRASSGAAPCCSPRSGRRPPETVEAARQRQPRRGRASERPELVVALLQGEAAARAAARRPVGEAIVAAAVEQQRRAAAQTAANRLADDDPMIAAGQPPVHLAFQEPEAVAEDRRAAGPEGEADPEKSFGPGAAKRCDSASWSARRMLIANAGVTLNCGSIWLRRSMANSTSGGSREREVTELAVMPHAPPVRPPVVITVTPVAKWPMMRRWAAPSIAIGRQAATAGTTARASSSRDRVQRARSSQSWAIMSSVPNPPVACCNARRRWRQVSTLPTMHSSFMT